MQKGFLLVHAAGNWEKPLLLQEKYTYDLYVLYFVFRWSRIIQNKMVISKIKT